MKYWGFITRAVMFVYLAWHLLITRAVMFVYLAWHLLIVVMKLRHRSSFVRTSRPSLTRVDLMLEVDGRPTQAVITLARTDEALTLHLRPDDLPALAEIDKALVPSDPDGDWPNHVLPPVTAKGAVAADTIDHEVVVVPVLGLAT
jgi:hypothetical protein